MVDSNLKEARRSCPQKKKKKKILRPQCRLGSAITPLINWAGSYGRLWWHRKLHHRVTVVVGRREAVG